MTDLIGDRTLPMTLDEVADARAGAPFLVFEAADGSVSEITYRALHENVQRLAEGLAGLGVAEGSKVCVHLRNCPEFVYAFFAIAYLGAVMVPTNVANGANEMRYALGHADVELIITSEGYLDLFAATLVDVPTVRAAVVTTDAAVCDLPVPIHSFATLLSSARRRQHGDVGAETPVEILFTSGTTANPKGVVLTHANCLWSGEREAQSFGLLPALVSGATFVLIEEYRATKFWEQVRRHRATHTALVAMLLRTLLRQPPAATDRDHCLRTVNYALNVPTVEKDQFESRFGVELINGYGLSEAMICVCAAPLSGERRWPSIGLPAVDRQVRIVDEDDRELPTGEVGEIVVWGVPGRTITLGYYNDPQASAEAIVDGWLHTGDNGYVDELGYFYFFDRKKDVIKRAGENISASEVEAVLLEHPKVALSAVIGIPDPIRDQAVMAFVVPAGERPDEEELIAFCKERLAGFKVPTVFEIRTSLPLTSIGKVEKKLLRHEGVVRHGA
jgi:crotonobetaine/carnitine-CoA ligase